MYEVLAPSLMATNSGNGGIGIAVAVVIVVIWLCKK